MSGQLVATGTAQVGRTIGVTNLPAGAAIAWCRDGGKGASWAQQIDGSYGKASYTLQAADQGLEVFAIAAAAGVGVSVGAGKSVPFGPIAAASSTPPVTPPVTPPAGGGSPAPTAGAFGLHRVAIASAAVLPGSPAGLSYEVIQPWENPELIKAINPECQVGAYVNIAALTTDGPTKSLVNGEGLYDTGVTAAAADATWFLKASSGASKVTLSGFSDDYMADPTNSGYWAAWVAYCAELKALGFDFIFADNCDTTPSGPCAMPAATYANGLVAMLGNVTPQLNEVGLEVIPNIGEAVTNPTTATAMRVNANGMMDEQFGKWGNTSTVGYRDSIDIKTQVLETQACAAENKVLLAVTHSAANDPNAAAFGLGVLMLGAGSSKQAFTMAPDYASDERFSIYTTAGELGAPSAAAVQAATGVWSRQFEKGTVTVNPNTFAAGGLAASSAKIALS